MNDLGYRFHYITKLLNVKGVALSFLKLLKLLRRDRKCLLERPVEGGIIGESDLPADLVQRHAMNDQRLCGDQPSLRDIAVETDIHFFAEQSRHRAFTDIELRSRRL